LILGVLVIADGSAAASGSRPAADVAVSVDDNFYDPADVVVNVGDTVTWTNIGLDVHTTTADDGSWDSGDLQPGDSFAFTFTVAGSYPYQCLHHGFLGQVGTITVQAAPPGTPPRTVRLINDRRSH
jgi:plastocyanin